MAAPGNLIRFHGTKAPPARRAAPKHLPRLRIRRRCAGRCAKLLAVGIGALCFDGNHDSCIALRTGVLKDGKAYVQAGAGVVADSVPENEYNETENKAKGMMRAIDRAKLLVFDPSGRRVETEARGAAAALAVAE